MRYIFVIHMFLSISLFSGLSFSSELETKENTKNNIVSEKNENICQQKFIKEIFNQQRIFSSGHITEKIRRIAERKIEAARESYNKTGSYCDAYGVLITFQPKNLENQSGDAQFD